jgi:xanthine dehydrogenase accessory factor
MFDRAALEEALREHPRVARVVIAAHDGSSPREVGAAMLVWSDQKAGGGQSGTVGGGALEWQAVQTARARLAEAGPLVTRLALGPSLGQCCGGAVTLLTEVYDGTSLDGASLDGASLPEGPIHARSVGGTPMPLAVKRLLAEARAQGTLPAPQLLQGWMIEPLSQPQRQIWLWGAGHVGRAIAATLAPLPGLAITWIDVAPDRFPDPAPAGVTLLPAADPGQAVRLAPQDAHHLILTFSHALDLDLCHRLLTHGFASCGLIGSATKWARFRSRLAKLGHAPGEIARITCPIGDPALGKHPHAIAIGVAAQVLQARAPSLAHSRKPQISHGGPGV